MRAQFQTLFTPDERTGIITWINGPLIVFDTGTGIVRYQLGKPAAKNLPGFQVVPGKNGGLSNRFALRQSTSPDRPYSMEVWDLRSGELWSRFELRTNSAPSQFRFTNDGSRLFVLSDGVVHIIDLRRSREVLRIHCGTLSKPAAQTQPTVNLSHLQLSEDERELTVYTYFPDGKYVRKEVFDGRPLSDQELARSRQIAEAPFQVSPPTPETLSNPKKPKTASDYFDLGTSLMSSIPGAAPKPLDPKAAVAAYREAIRLDPDFFALHSKLAAALTAAGNDEGAIAAYREAVKRYPADVGSWNQIGQILERRGDRTGAIEAYRGALRHHESTVSKGLVGIYGGGYPPSRADLHYNLGRLLLDTNDPAGAESEFREAVRLHPDFYVIVARQLVPALIRQGKFPQAEIEAKAFVKLVEETAARNNPMTTNPTIMKTRIDREIGSALDSLGHAYIWNIPSRTAEATEWFEQAARRYTAIDKAGLADENDKFALYNIHRNRSIAFNWSGHVADALVEIDLARKTVRPQDLLSLQILRARYQAKTKDWPQAERAAVELLKTPPEPKPTWFLWDAVLVHALCSRNAKEEKERERLAATAVKLLDQAVENGWNGWNELRWLGWEPDVDPLRDRADFKKLEEKLKNKLLREQGPPPREKK